MICRHPNRPKMDRKERLERAKAEIRSNAIINALHQLTLYAKMALLHEEAKRANRHTYPSGGKAFVQDGEYFIHKSELEKIDLKKKPLINYKKR